MTPVMRSSSDEVTEPEEEEEVEVLQRERQQVLDVWRQSSESTAASIEEPRVFMKYGDSYYHEEDVPPAYTVLDGQRNTCRFVSSFLVYNRKGERLTRLDVLPRAEDNLPSHLLETAATLCLFGALLPYLCIQQPEIGKLVRRNLERRKHRRQDLPPPQMPFPARIQITQYRFDYGQQPSDPPYMWVKSTAGIWYRLETPAGRYETNFADLALRFEIASKFLKTLQADQNTSFHEMTNLLMYGNRRGIQNSSTGDPILKGNRVNRISSSPSAELTPWGTRYRCWGFSMKGLWGLAQFLVEECQKFALAIFGVEASEAQKATLLQSNLMQPIQDARMGFAGGSDGYARMAAPNSWSGGDPYGGAAAYGAETRMMMAAQAPAANPYMLMDGYAGAWGAPPRPVWRTELHVTTPKILAHPHDDWYQQLTRRQPAEGVIYAQTDKVVVGFEPSVAGASPSSLEAAR
eukprot:Protomagalhaensia_sp_Gyna_25__5958@NODE_91_length_5343_cov_32_408937_g70_i0_p2_GENE_NODE_91_length_5343_cov_32_408937_g70_i0NODE_91_length_5343_cov_32_408937_g70_i0_p2_ORF_typecomplete_len462_score60_20DNMT1RFD/PF12047_8/4_4e12_NODE_91_length_5343_cov_32_408937_g70_i014442829